MNAIYLPANKTNIKNIEYNLQADVTTREIMQQITEFTICWAAQKLHGKPWTSIVPIQWLGTVCEDSVH